MGKSSQLALGRKSAIFYSCSEPLLLVLAIALAVEVLFVESMDFFPERDATAARDSANADFVTFQLRCANATHRQSTTVSCAIRLAVAPLRNVVSRAALYSDSFANYSSERKNDVGGLFTDATITTSWLETFLKPGSTGDWAKYDNWRIYDVGFLASEVLAALQGPQSIMQLYREVALGKSYEAAFLGIYGISWNDAVPILAQAIHSLINP